MRKSQFCLHKHSLKTIRCTLLYIPNDFYNRTSSFSGSGRRMSYTWRATTKKQSPSMQDARVCRLLFMYSGCGKYSQATPRLLNACGTVCDEFASRQLSTSRSWTTVFSVYLVLKTILVPRKTPLCI